MVQVRLAFPVLEIYEDSTEDFPDGPDLRMGGIIASRCVFLESGRGNSVEAWNMTKPMEPELLVAWFGTDDMELYAALCNMNFQRTLSPDLLSMHMTKQRIAMVERAYRRLDPYDAVTLEIIDRNVSESHRLHLFN